MIDRIEGARAAQEVQLARGGAGGEPEQNRRALSLIGTWPNVGDEPAKQIRKAINERGGWASWWSFPVRQKFHGALRKPFFVYLNAGGNHIAYRMKVEQFRTTRGSEGMPSPWPEITDPEQQGKKRAGPSQSEVFNTWFYVTAFEEIESPFSPEDFETADDDKPSLVNRNSFGYAYLKQTEAMVTAGTEKAPVNLILYGPPGTGKTYWLREKFKEYTDEATQTDQAGWRQEIVAGHGWRAVVAATLAKLGGPARVPDIRDHEWVQSKIAQLGRDSNIHQTLWGTLQHHTPPEVETVRAGARRPPFIFTKTEKSEWSLLPDWEREEPEAQALFQLLNTGPTQTAAPVRRYRVVTFHPSYSYEDFIRGIRPVAGGEDGPTEFRLVDGIFKRLCDEARATPAKRYALFVDEINRANIAKVFGELITLVEPDKRALYDDEGRLISGMVVQLPGAVDSDAAERPFGVPANLDIYGTMNTADRSIALLDVALRRRFEFREVEPNYGLIDRNVESVHLGKLLRRVNDRLEYLLDRDHRIGHAYLMKVWSLADLRRAFRMQVIPLLQEYFFDDLSRVDSVLATSAAAPFVRSERLRHGELFTGGPLARDHQAERVRYQITPDHTWAPASFTGIYSAASSDESAIDVELDGDNE